MYIIYNVCMFWPDCNFFKHIFLKMTKILFFSSFISHIQDKLHIMHITVIDSTGYCVDLTCRIIYCIRSISNPQWNCICSQKSMDTRDFYRDFGGLMQIIFHVCFAGVSVIVYKWKMWQVLKKVLVNLSFFFASSFFPPFRT